jgi:hypothetical protein
MREGAAKSDRFFAEPAADRVDRTSAKAGLASNHIATARY